MSIINFSSFFTIIGIFILGIIIYPNPKDKKSLLQLSGFCQIAAFLISLIFILIKYEAFVRANSESYYEFWYFVTLNIYASVINLGLRIFTQFKYGKLDK
jgi:tellurite resistance protein TehA-like permease